MPIAVVVLGGASCVWTDYDAACHLLDGAGVQHVPFVINDMLAVFPREATGVTLHPDKLAAWLKVREQKGLPKLEAIWAHRPFAGVTNSLDDWGGSSGLFACHIALYRGFTKIILCGVPMTVDGMHFVRQQRWNACSAFRRAWEQRHAQIAPFVRSMSGWTAERLGQPTIEFLKGDDPCSPA